VSFGAVAAGALPVSKALTITNTGSSALTLAVSVAATKAAAGTTVATDQQSLNLAAGKSATLNVTLSGTVPTAGVYTGSVLLSSGNASARIPYMFVVGTGTPYNIVPVFGTGFDGTTGQDVGAYGIKLVDPYGLPAKGTVTFQELQSGAMTLSSVPGTAGCTPATSTTSISCATDSFGMAYVDVKLGQSWGSTTLRVRGAGASFTTSVTIRQPPAITTAGVVNAASGTASIAPGSYIAIYGSALSDPGYIDSATTSRLPLSLDAVTVSFDVPSAGLSVPAHMVYVSPTQVDVQVPWELQGQSSAQMKVTINQFSFGNVVTVPIAAYSPAFFLVGTAPAALDSSYGVITATNPAKRGQSIALYVNGLGPVTNPPASGDPASSSTLSYTTTQPKVSIGGVDAPVVFSGLAPGFAGLYQVNVTVPSGVSPGAQPITISIGGQTSPAATIPVQ
jgi:uncharacterized protein (TIGR03437 family)